MRFGHLFLRFLGPYLMSSPHSFSLCCIARPDHPRPVWCSPCCRLPRVKHWNRWAEPPRICITNSQLLHLVLAFTFVVQIGRRLRDLLAVFALKESWGGALVYSQNFTPLSLLQANSAGARVMQKCVFRPDRIWNFAVQNSGTTFQKTFYNCPCITHSNTHWLHVFLQIVKRQMYHMWNAFIGTMNVGTTFSVLPDDAAMYLHGRMTEKTSNSKLK